MKTKKRNEPFVTQHLRNLENQYLFSVTPAIRALAMVVYSSIGKTVHLRCSATAPFDTIMYWRRFDNQTISSQSSRYRQQQHMHHNHLQTTLYIRDVEIDDFGLYACYAESKAGRSQAVMELKQHRHPLTTIAEPTATVRTQILKRNKSKLKTIFVH